MCGIRQRFPTFPTYEMKLYCSWSFPFADISRAEAERIIGQCFHFNRHWQFSLFAEV